MTDHPIDGPTSDVQERSSVSSPSVRERKVSAAFVALADTLVDDYDVIDLLDQLIAHCTNLLSADAAGILLADAHHQLQAVAASSEDARTMELLQLLSEEGPCWDAFHTVAQVLVPDLSEAAQRWPRFVAAATRAGPAQTEPFASVHAIPLRLRGEAIGALNLFHREPSSLSPADLALGQALADVATIGILQERAIRHGEIVTEQLQHALNNRIVIEQAKGVLAQHHHLTMTAAFERLRSHARSHNERLTDVARRCVTGQLDLDTLTAVPRSDDVAE